MERLIREQGHSELIPTAMTLTKTTGESFHSRTDHASGDPWEEDAVVTDEVLKDKFRLFCEPYLSTDQIDDAITRVSTLEHQPDATGLIAALVAEDRAAD